MGEPTATGCAVNELKTKLPLLEDCVDRIIQSCLPLAQKPNRSAPKVEPRVTSCPSTAPDISGFLTQLTSLQTDLRKFNSQLSEYRSGVTPFEPTCRAPRSYVTQTPSSTGHRLGMGDQPQQLFQQLESCLYQFPNDPGRLLGKPCSPLLQRVRRTRQACEAVWQAFFSLRLILQPSDVISSLMLPTFNNWNFSDAELLGLLRYLFLDLKLPQQCKFSIKTLDAWLCAVYRRYNEVPFHNFKHAFTVTQMMYSLIKLAKLDCLLSSIDLFTLMFSAICHDLDHPGFTNSYQVNARTLLALRYNDISPLENHHCAVAFDLLSTPLTNICSQFSQSEYSWIRLATTRCILGTDMVKHCEQVALFRKVLPELYTTAHSTATPKLKDVIAENSELRLTLMVILLKVADISNEIRPPVVSGPWLQCLLDEFFTQARFENSVGLPVAAHMDPNLVTPSASQIGFIRNLLIPLLEDLIHLFPALTEPFLHAASAHLAEHIVAGDKEKRTSRRPVFPVETTIPERKPEFHAMPISSSLLLPGQSVSDHDANPITSPPSGASTAAQGTIPFAETNVEEYSSSPMDVTDSMQCTSNLSNESSLVMEASAGTTGAATTTHNCLAEDTALLEERASRKSSTGSMVTATS